MRALFLRELRRQLPYALGPLLLVFLAPLLHEALSNATWSTLRELLRAEVAFAFLAGLVGVGAVAPERGSGAHAFLRRLPLALSRAFAVRAGAALGFLALGSCALALEVAVTGASLHPVVFAAPGAFALGLLASVVSERPLAALGITIPLSGVLIVAYFGPLLALGVRPPSAGSAAVLATVPPS